MAKTASRALRSWAIGALFVAFAACGSSQEPAAEGISLDRFVAVNVALRQIDRRADDADSLRAAVLAEHGTSEDELRAFVQARADDPLALASVWDEIHRRLMPDDPGPGITAGPFRLDTLETAPDTLAGETAPARLRTDTVAPAPATPQLPEQPRRLPRDRLQTIQ